MGTFFRLVGKAIKMAVHRPIQRFNIFNRAKKHLGEDSKYFMPAPRAIGALSQNKPSLYPHLEGQSGFKSIKQKRLEAIEKRNQKLLMGKTDGTSSSTSPAESRKSFSETIDDDNLIINASNSLPVVKTVTTLGSQPGDLPPDAVKQDRPHRPLPTSTNLQLSDPAVIWQVDKVPPGRLDLNKFQELMINKLADDEHWTPAQIAETYNIKEEYAANLTRYFKQIRIIISPRVAKNLEYVARNDPVYQATKHVIYHVDKALRDDTDRIFDQTFLPTDQLEPEIRDMLDAGAVQKRHQPDPRLLRLYKRPKPLQVNAINKPAAEIGSETDKQPPAKQIESASANAERSKSN